MASSRPHILPSLGSLWAAGGFLLILVPTVAVLTYMDIGRQKAQSTQLLLEKGAALIRSFEAGTRTGMMGSEPGMFRLQRLLAETAQQEDIVYLLVADDQGRVVVHDDAARIGTRHGSDLDLEAVVVSGKEAWRITEGPGHEPVFEVYRKFMPSGQAPAGRHGSEFRHRHSPNSHRGAMMMRRWLEENWPQGAPPSADRLAIFVGLDMGSVEAARAANTRHAVVMAVTMSAAGAVGILLLALLQTYRTTRASLNRIQAFSDRLVAHMPIGMVALGPAGEVATVNPAGAAILNITPESALGRPAHEVLPPALADLAGRLQSGGQRLDAELDAAVAPGPPLPLAVSAAALNEAPSPGLSRILLFKDMSEVRALEATVERAQRLAAVGSLAGGVAHEIRNPLSSLKGFATFFKERNPPDSEAWRIAGIMIQEVDRLDRVVGQLLELSRPVRIAPRPLAVGSTIETAAALLRSRAREAGVALAVDLAPDLPPVPLDPERFHQVLLNLLLNALEASDKGGRIQVGARADGTHLEIQVSDRGAGIAPEALDRVFDPYFTTKSTGTGLGLAIVHQIVEAHRGTVQIQSQPGQGTTVRLRLPRHPEEP